LHRTGAMMFGILFQEIFWKDLPKKGWAVRDLAVVTSITDFKSVKSFLALSIRSLVRPC
jgi:hypothetical protein